MKTYDQAIVTALRLSLALIFIWFGALKIAGYNPVAELITNSLAPWLASGSGLLVLGVGEVTIGLLLLINRPLVFTHILLVGHLVGTFSTFLIGPAVVFSPSFPILSLAGEFVIKNIVLALAGLAVLNHELRRG